MCVCDTPIGYLNLSCPPPGKHHLTLRLSYSEHMRLVQCQSRVSLVHHAATSYDLGLYVCNPGSYYYCRGVLMSCSYVARKCRYRLHLYWCLYSHSGAIMRTRRFFQSLYSNPLSIDDLPRDLNCDIYVPPYGYFDRPHILHKLGIASWERFQHNASLDDLNRSIGLIEGAVQLAPEGHE